MEERQHVSNEALFMGLVINLHATAMIALGKITSPLTQKIERNLEQARFTIDMLGMLEAKTAGNRTEEESRTLRTILTELRLNYIDELEKDELAEKNKETVAGAGTSGSGDTDGAAERPAGTDKAETEKTAGPRNAEGTAGAEGTADKAGSNDEKMNRRKAD